MTDAFFSGVSFLATDVPSAAPAGGQGFAMSSSEMQALLEKAVTMRDTIRSQFRHAERLAMATPPADEPVSRNAVLGANGVNETGRFYVGHLQYQDKYLTELIRRLRQALGMTVENEQRSAELATKRGSLE